MSSLCGGRARGEGPLELPAPSAPEGGSPAGEKAAAGEQQPEGGDGEALNPQIPRERPGCWAVLAGCGRLPAVAGGASRFPQGAGEGRSVPTVTGGPSFCRRHTPRGGASGLAGGGSGAWAVFGTFEATRANLEDAEDETIFRFFFFFPWENLQAPGVGRVGAVLELSGLFLMSVLLLLSVGTMYVVSCASAAHACVCDRLPA